MPRIAWAAGVESEGHGPRLRASDITRKPALEGALDIAETNGAGSCLTVEGHAVLRFESGDLIEGFQRALAQAESSLDGGE